MGLKQEFGDIRIPEKLCFALSSVSHGSECTGFLQGVLLLFYNGVYRIRLWCIWVKGNGVFRLSFLRSSYSFLVIRLYTQSTSPTYEHSVILCRI